MKKTHCRKYLIRFGPHADRYVERSGGMYTYLFFGMFNRLCAAAPVDACTVHVHFHSRTSLRGHM